MRIFHHIHVVQRIQKSLKFGQFTLMFCRVRHKKKTNKYHTCCTTHFSSLSQSGHYCFLPLSLPGRSRVIFSIPKKTRKGDMSTSYSSIQYSLLVYFRSLGTERLPKGKKKYRHSAKVLFILFCCFCHESHSHWFQIIN